MSEKPTNYDLTIMFQDIDQYVPWQRDRQVRQRLDALEAEVWRLRRVEERFEKVKQAFSILNEEPDDQ